MTNGLLRKVISAIMFLMHPMDITQNYIYLATVSSQLASQQINKVLGQTNQHSTDVKHLVRVVCFCGANTIKLEAGQSL